MTEAYASNYWISPTALYITLNALGMPNYIQANTAGGSVIMCHVPEIIGYDDGHNYRRWQLIASPTLFNSNSEKYVYVQIPRDMSKTTAMVVFPSEHIDLYGKNEAQQQIGSADYYYIWLQAKITATNGTSQRTWDGTVNHGTLSTDEAYATQQGEWFKWDAVTQMVTFVKTVFSATINYLTIGKELIFGDGDDQKKVTQIADGTDMTDDSAEHIATPAFVTAFGNSHFLRKDQEDTTNYLLNLLGGIKFNSPYGITAAGAATFKSLMAEDGTFTNNLITKNLTVTGMAHFFELVIDKISSIGGAVILTPANGFTVSDVAEGNDSYTLYYVASDADGNGITNDWKVGDQALCQSFNATTGVSHNVSNKLYWCKVTAVSSDVTERTINGHTVECHSITISKTQKLANCTVNPEVGDNIVMLGYQGTDDPDRQSALYLSAYNSIDGGYIDETTGKVLPALKAPFMAQYKGINDFDLAKHRKSYYDATGAHIIGSLTVEGDSGETPLDEYINNNTKSFSIETSAYVIASDEYGDPYDMTPLKIYAKSKGLSETAVWNVELHKGSIVVSKSTMITNGWLTENGNEITITSEGIDKICEGNYEILKVSATCEEFSDQLDIQVVSDGGNGVNGKDAYTVILTNANHSFHADDGGVVEEATTSTEVISYKGATKIACTIPPIITTGIAGLTATVISLGGSDTNAKIEIKATSALTVKQGVFSIPITIDGKDFSQDFSFTVTENGSKGEDGKSVVSLKAYYNHTTAEFEELVSEIQTWTVVSLLNAEVGMSLVLTADNRTNGGYRIYYGVITAISTSGEHPRVTFTMSGYTDGGANGTNGTNGTNGDDAIEFIVDPTPVFFSTNDSGKVTEARVVVIKAIQGGSEIPFTIVEGTHVNCTVAVSESEGNTKKFTLAIPDDAYTEIESVYDPTKKYYIAPTSGVAVFTATVGKVSYPINIAFEVDIQASFNNFSVDNKAFKSTYDAFTYDNGVLTGFGSVLEQTAKRISLSVGEKSAGCRNVLDDSTFERTIDNRYLQRCEFLNSETFEGTKVARCEAPGKSGDTQYYSMIKYGAVNESALNIQLKPNTKYTLSVWMKRSDIEATHRAFVQIYRHDSSNATTAVSILKGKTLYPATDWSMYQVEFTTDDYEYYDVRIGFTSTDENGFYGYIARPMLEEGEYNGWTPSVNDPDPDGIYNGLKESGIDITSRRIVAFTDNFVVSAKRDGSNPFMTVDEAGIHGNNMFIQGTIEGSEIKGNDDNFLLDKNGNARFGGVSGQRIDINPNTKKILFYNNSNEPTTELSGDTSVASEIIPSIGTVSVTHGSDYITIEKANDESVSDIEEVVAEKEFSVGSACTLDVTYEKVELYAHIDNKFAGALRVYGYIVLQKKNGDTYEDFSQEYVGDIYLYTGSDKGTTKVVGDTKVSAKLTKGVYRVVLRVQYLFASSSYGNEGTWSVTLSAKRDELNLVKEGYFGKFLGNGLALVANSSEYLISLFENLKLMWAVRNSQTGLRLTADKGFEGVVGANIGWNGKWAKQPIVVYSALISAYYNNTRKVDKVFSCLGEEPTIVVGSDGSTFTIRDFDNSIDLQDCFIMATARGVNIGYDATVVVPNKSTLDVHVCSDNGVFIEIKQYI